MKQRNNLSPFNEESKHRDQCTKELHKVKFTHWKTNERELYKIIEAEIERDNFPSDIVLHAALLDSEIPFRRGGEIFLAIRDLYGDKFLRLKKENAIDSKISKTKRRIKLLEITVTFYFHQKLMEELGQTDLPSARMQLKKLKMEMQNSFDPISKFLLRSVEMCLVEIEADIELEKEAADLRNQLGLTKPKDDKNIETDDKNIETDDKNIEANEYKKIKNPEFTTTRQVLALRYLLEYVKAKDKTRRARKKFIQFLIDKDESTIGKKYDDEGLAYNKDGDDLSFVRKQFEDLGLSEILRMIDNDKT